MDIPTPVAFSYIADKAQLGTGLKCDLVQSINVVEYSGTFAWCVSAMRVIRIDRTFGLFLDGVRLQSRWDVAVLAVRNNQVAVRVGYSLVDPEYGGGFSVGICRNWSVDGN